MSEWAEKRSLADTHLQERMREVSPLAIDKGSYQLAVQLEELKSRDQLTVQLEEESYLKLENTQNSRTLILQLEELKLRNLELTREKEVLAEVFRIGQVPTLLALPVQKYNTDAASWRGQEYLHDANQALAETAAAKDAENVQLQECITEMQRLLGFKHTYFYFYYWDFNIHISISITYFYSYSSFDCLLLNIEAGADRLLYVQDANQALVETAAATDIATTRQVLSLLALPVQKYKY